MSYRALRTRRARVAFAHDVVMAGLSLPLSLLLRLGGDAWTYGGSPPLQSTVLFTLVAAAVFWSMRLYGGVWRYASLNDLAMIARAVTVAILVFSLLMFLFTRLDAVPRSTFVINWFVLMILLGGPRVVYRMFKDRRIAGSFERNGGSRIPVLLVGAGDEAEQFIRAVDRNARAAYRVVGLIDEKGARIGRSIHGVHVLGDVGGLPLVFERLTRAGKRPQRLILATERIDGAVVRSLVEMSEALGAGVSRLPKLTDLQTGPGGADIRPVAVEDLLRRPQTMLDRARMAALVEGRRILITGAGGTIGRELARQTAALGPAGLCLLDNSEHHLYEIDLEIDERCPDLRRRSILADIRDADRIQGIVARERPALLFHAAALKHVPIAETHAEEAILTNAIGTRIVADACRAGGVDAMLLISTDKAVNPAGVMGTTKRIAESYCQALDLSGAGPDRTRFVTVRFGNVLGSTGSVVPLFQRQLAAGGPLTVTHPDMTRYFMTTREAVELALEACALGARDRENAGKIYVLDMGDPVRIVDLARQMILLAGLEPDTDVKIEYTGPRAGEKLAEELLHESERPAPTEYRGILLAAPRTADHAFLARTLEELAAAARRGDGERSAALLQRLVPEYRPGGGMRGEAAAR